MKHIKTNEEYRFFKGRKKSWVPNTDYFSSDTPNNVKDPNEPFLNKNKPKYLKTKRTKEILNLLGIPASVWFPFISSLKNLFSNMNDTLVSENGKALKIDNNAEYYYIELNTNSDNENKIYIFPNKKKIVVRCFIHEDTVALFKVKKVFSYPNDENVIKGTAREAEVYGNVLDDIYKYLKNSVGDLFDKKMKREEEMRKIRQSRHDSLLSEEEPSKPKSHDNGVNLNADDTATFDNLNHVKSFKNYIRS